MSHCCSNHTHHNIHEDVYSKWFLGLNTSQPVSSLLNQRATCDLLLRHPIQTVVPCCDLLQQLSFRTCLILSTPTACCHTTARQHYMACLWSHTLRHSTKIMSLCCNEACACGCGMTPTSAAALMKDQPDGRPPLLPVKFSKPSLHISIQNESLSNLLSHIPVKIQSKCILNNIQ